MGSRKGEKSEMGKMEEEKERERERGEIGAERRLRGNWGRGDKRKKGLPTTTTSLRSEMGKALARDPLGLINRWKICKR